MSVIVVLDIILVADILLEIVHYTTPVMLTKLENLIIISHF